MSRPQMSRTRRVAVVAVASAMVSGGVRLVEENRDRHTLAHRRSVDDGWEGDDGVRGFDSTKTIAAGLGADGANFADADVGHEGSIYAGQRDQRAQRDQAQLHGLCGRQTGPGDSDVGNPASHHRRAGVRHRAQLSAVNPGPYLDPAARAVRGLRVRQHLLQRRRPATSLWGFGFNGCLVPANPGGRPRQLRQAVSLR